VGSTTINEMIATLSQELAAMLVEMAQQIS
jgi:hypothetical protein